MSDSNQSPREVSGTLMPGDCHAHHTGCCDHDEELHVHVHLHRPCCPPTPQVPQVPEEHHENFDGVPTQLINAGGSIKVPAMTITQVSGPGQCGVSSYAEIPDMLSGQALVLCNGKDEVTPQLVRLDFAFACDRLKFAITCQHKPVTLRFYDKQDKLQGTRDLLPAEGANKWIEFSAPPGGKVSRMDISVSDWLYMDFFSFFSSPLAQPACCEPSEEIHVHVHTHYCCECPSCKDEKRYETFEDVAAQLISAGGVIETTTMTITHVAGDGRSGIAVNTDIAGRFEKQGLVMSQGAGGTTGQTLQLQLKGGCSRVKFAVVWMNSSLKIVFYKKDGAVLEEKTLLGMNNPGGAVQQWVDFTAQGAEEIAMIQFQTPDTDWIGFDFFEFFGWCPLK